MSLIEYRVEGGIALIRLNRPERLNALNHAMRDELLEAYADFVANDAARVGLITGSGRAFSAGRDLQEQAEAQASGAEVNLAPEYSRLWGFFDLPETDKPLVAAVNGYAIGSGFYMVLGCDVRVAAESAEFAMGQVPTGLLGPYWLSAAESLPWCIAAELALLGDRIDARRALQHGLLNEVVPDERLMDVAMGYATRLLALPPLHVQRTKALMRGMRRLPNPQGVERELEIRSVLDRLDDTREAAAAFAERRAPRFTGR